MKKKFIAGIALGLSMLANLAYAELAGQYVQTVLKDNNNWPLSAVCTGSDVNVRTEPNTNCDVITMLNKGDKFYITDVIFKDDYTWMKGYISSGFASYTEGYMVSKYLDQAPRAATPSERFRAAFETGRNYDMNALAKACGIEFQYNPSMVQTLSKDVFHYAPQRVMVGPHEVHGEKLDDSSTVLGPNEIRGENPNDRFTIIGVMLKAPGYKIAGLEVGKSVTEEEMQKFDKNMNFISWNGQSFDEDNMKQYIWYLDDTVDGHARPVEAFRVSVKDNVIKEIRFHHIPID